MPVGNLQNDRSQRAALESLLDGTSSSLAAKQDATIAADRLGPGSVPRSVAARLADVVSVKDRGAKGDGSTNDRDAIQNTIDAIYNAGGGTAYMPAGTYIINSAIQLKPNVILRGAGMYASILKVGVDNIQAIALHALGGTSGMIGLEDMTVWGYADRNETLGNDTMKLASPGPCQFAYATSVRFIYSRHMSFTPRATVAHATGCRVEKSQRDGINLQDSKHKKVINCYIDGIGDDAIVLNASTTSPLTYDQSAVAIGNTIRRALGIKCLGGRNVTITNNDIAFWYGYAIFFGFDNATAETYGSTFNINISDNVIRDGINSNLVGGGSQITAIYLRSGRSLGSGDDAVPAHIGTYNSGTVAFVLPEPAINKIGSTAPIAAGRSIIVTGNNIIQTLGKKLDGTAASVFSDFGMGALYGKTGVLDPSISTLIRTPVGVEVIGDFVSLRIAKNTFIGLQWANRFQSQVAGISRQIVVENNTVFRCSNAFGIVQSVATHVDIEFRDNNINLDPYHESADRTSPLDGSWSTTGGTTDIAFTLDFTRGVKVLRNTIRNSKRVLSSGTFVAFYRDNNFYYDWRNTLSSDINWKGIRLIGMENDNNHFFEDSDPTSATYGLQSGISDSAYLRSSAAVPTTGMFKRGQVILRAPATSGSSWGWACTVSGGATGATWASGQTYAAGVWRKGLSSPNYVYSLVTAGGGTTANEPVGTTIGAAETGADGYVWKLECTSEAAFKTFGTLS